MNNYYLSNSYYGRNYRTRKFVDIFPDVNTFMEEFDTVSIPKMISDDNARTLYFLLYANYGNSHIANSDENQFKYKVFAIIFKDGKKWEKRLETQSRISNLTEQEIFQTFKTINNNAFNPGDIVTQDALLNTINEQSVSTSTIGKVTALVNYSKAFENCTDEFLLLFKKLFLIIVAPERALWYVQEENEEE